MNTTRYPVRLGATVAAGWLLLSLLPVVAQDRPVLMTLEVRGIHALVDDVNRVSMALQLGPQGAIMLRALDRMAGEGGFTGVATNGTLQAVVFQPAAEASPASKPAVVLIPVTDGGRVFVDRLTARMTRLADTGGGVMRFEPTAGRPGRGELLVALSGDVAVLGAEAELVSEALAQLQAGTLIAGTRIGVPGSVAVDLNMPALGKLMRESTHKLSALGGSREIAKAQGQMDAFADLIEQMTDVQFGLSTDARSLVINTHMAARPGTTLAGILANTRAPDTRYLSLLPDNLMVAQVGHIGGIDRIMDLYRSLVAGILEPMGPEGAQMLALMDANLADTRGLLTGDYAVGLDAAEEGHGVRVAYAMGVTDATRVPGVIDRFVDGLTTLKELPEGMKISATRSAGRAYREVEIMGIQYNLAMGDAAGGDPAIAGMLGIWSNAAYEVACVGDVALFTMGDSALMDRMLDRLLTPGQGGTSLRDHALLRRLFADDSALARADQLVVMSLVEYVKFTLAMMPGVDASMLAMFPASESGLAGYSVTRNGTQRSTIKVAFEEMVAIKSMVPFMMMGAMTGGGMGGGAGGGAPEGMDDDAAGTADEDPADTMRPE